MKKTWSLSLWWGTCGRLHNNRWISDRLRTGPLKCLINQNSGGASMWRGCWWRNIHESDHSHFSSVDQDRRRRERNLPDSFNTNIPCSFSRPPWCVHVSVCLHQHVGRRREDVSEEQPSRDLSSRPAGNWILTSCLTFKWWVLIFPTTLELLVSVPSTFGAKLKKRRKLIWIPADYLPLFRRIWFYRFDYSWLPAARLIIIWSVICFWSVLWTSVLLWFVKHFEHVERGDLKGPSSNGVCKHDSNHVHHRSL